MVNIITNSLQDMSKACTSSRKLYNVSYIFKMFTMKNKVMQKICLCFWKYSISWHKYIWMSLSVGLKSKKYFKCCRQQVLYEPIKIKYKHVLSKGDNGKKSLQWQSWQAEILKYTYTDHFVICYIILIKQPPSS